MNSNALIIIAKYPDKENVKTRLKELMPDEKRLEIYETLLHRTVENLGTIAGTDTFIAFVPGETEDYFLQFGVRLVPLDRGDLGTGMYAAFKEVFDAGYQKAALVGADIPDLSTSIILDAFDVLSENSLVYGPAIDGGYYLVGMKKLIREVFENVPWSSEQTLEKSIVQANSIGESVGFTKTLYDIDTLEDVKRAGFIF
jgi:rSAM/selenodomain-associated transferase 1